MKISDLSYKNQTVSRKKPVKNSERCRPILKHLHTLKIGSKSFNKIVT